MQQDLNPFIIGITTIITSELVYIKLKREKGIS